MDVKLNKAFEQMRSKAKELGYTGVMGIAQKHDDGELSLHVRECGMAYNDDCNFYGIVCGKIFEMVRTGKPSGTLAPLLGEFENFIGGTFAGNYYVAFSGAPCEIDLEIAELGLSVLVD